MKMIEFFIARKLSLTALGIQSQSAVCGKACTIRRWHQGQITCHQATSAILARFWRPPNGSASDIRSKPRRPCAGGFRKRADSQPSPISNSGSRALDCLRRRERSRSRVFYEPSPEHLPTPSRRIAGVFWPAKASHISFLNCLAVENP